MTLPRNDMNLNQLAADLIDAAHVSSGAPFANPFRSQDTESHDVFFAAAGVIDQARLEAKLFGDNAPTFAYHMRTEHNPSIKAVAKNFTREACEKLKNHIPAALQRAAQGWTVSQTDAGTFYIHDDKTPVVSGLYRIAQKSDQTGKQLVRLQDGGVVEINDPMRLGVEQQIVVHESAMDAFLKPAGLSKEQLASVKAAPRPVGGKAAAV